MNGKIEVKTEEDLEKMINEEKERVLRDKELEKAFNKIEKSLDKNIQTRELLVYIKENQIIVEQLANIPLFKRKLWIAYLFNSKDTYNDLLSFFKTNENKLDEIITRIKSEQNDWEDIIAKFNKRFDAPFKLTIENKEDVILHNDTPNVEFFFEDRPIKEKDIIKVLSQGEKRALYLLNIIFEVEGRKKLDLKTLFIIDDIADSFDYQNKYAIIEYLKDISKIDRFYQIILTHNYDFYRTAKSRLLNAKTGGKYDYNANKLSQLQTIKLDSEILLQPDDYVNNPFKDWKKNLNDEQKLIACIPLVRNLAEYSNKDDDLLYLTSLLHIKDNTKQIKVCDFARKIKDITGVDISRIELDQRLVIDVIFDNADKITNHIQEEALRLEAKITLSIAIRLKAEQFMINEINDPTKIALIEKNQTQDLYELYKNLLSKILEKEKTLERVNLMTPENIHLNSFMYEPIIDMSAKKLKELYKDVCNLNKLRF